MEPKRDKKSRVKPHVVIETTAYVYALAPDGTRICTEILPVSWKEYHR